MWVQAVPSHPPTRQDPMLVPKMQVLCQQGYLHLAVLLSADSAMNFVQTAQKAINSLPIAKSAISC